MKILAIETSCDETAIAILKCTGDEKSAMFTMLGNVLLSQIEIHRKYGGVFPALAKREHAKNLAPILEAALEEAELLHEDMQMVSEEMYIQISEILVREPGLIETFFKFIYKYKVPEIDVVAVTTGPGLEPALWVGINFAKALALIWKKPLVAINHMEGHIFAALARLKDGEQFSISNLQFPILALLISGGHTQLVLMHKWLQYKLIGETRDDAVGEAFDKVARMLALPYPGGPEISRLAESVRQGFRNPSSDDGFRKPITWAKLPRPMIDSVTCDFSFAGLKTAALYLLRDIPNISENDKKHLAHEFENAVADVLWHKTSRALAETGARTLVIGGGVSANTHIKRTFQECIAREYPEVALRIPPTSLSTDNAVMIALAGYYRALQKEFKTEFVANGNLSLAKRP